MSNLVKMEDMMGMKTLNANNQRSNQDHAKSLSNPLSKEVMMVRGTYPMP